MKFRQFILLVSSMLITTAFSVDAQQYIGDEYRAEIGLSGGGGYYLGEANTLPFTNIQPVVGGLFRYKVNQRVALRAELTGTVVAGSGIAKNRIFIGDLCAEFNFFDLEQNPYKRLSKTFSPYIFTGLSLATDVYNKQKLPVAGIPFGIGMKIKLKNRINLNIQWTNRLMLADNLEGTTSPQISDRYNDPKQLNGTNIFNNDMLSALTLAITIDIWKKGCKCLNSDYR